MCSSFSSGKKCMKDEKKSCESNWPHHFQSLKFFVSLFDVDCQLTNTLIRPGKKIATTSNHGTKKEVSRRERGKGVEPLNILITLAIDVPCYPVHLKTVCTLPVSHFVNYQLHRIVSFIFSGINTIVNQPIIKSPTSSTTSTSTSPNKENKNTFKILGNNNSSDSEIEDDEFWNYINLRIMDLPGPSSSTNNIVRPISVYYPPPPTPPQLQLTQQQQAAMTLPFLYTNLLMQANSKSQYLIKSDISAFKEVNDLRTTFNLLIPTLYSAANGLGAAVPVANLFQPQQSQAASVPQAISTSDDALAVQNAVRKRSAAPPSPTTQPECPVSIGVLNQTNPFVFPHWMMAPLRAQSPALPTANITMPVTGIQVPSADEQAVKWSSPSSVDSNGQKTDSSIVSESQNIDIVGDGSESSTSSASAQEPIAQSFYQAVQNTAQQQVVQALLNCDGKSFYSNAQAIDNAALRVAPAPSSSAIKPATVAATIGPERKPRKPVNDDIVKIVRQQDLSAEAISKIEIPVPQALQSEPTFRPVSEQQIIQQIIQGKKYEEKDVGECMIQLCKKLAEKRVFGPRLMSQTTVAGLNHSNYSNLPIQGICYIQHICWKVLRDKFNHDEDFWDKFREAMRKLAARCRRVRHAKKTKSHREESLAQQELLQKRFGEDLPQSLSHTIHSLGLTALQPKPEIGFETLLSSDMHKVQIGQLLNTLGTLKMKDRQAAQEAVAQSLLQLANNGDFTVKSESLSPV